jgi:hypothetical protein
MPTDTLDLTHPTLLFKSVAKDRWFYDRFEYCMAFRLNEINCLRELNHASIDDTIERRRQWREMAQKRWIANGTNVSMHRFYQEITEKTLQDLHKLADVLLATQEEFKLVVGINEGHVYSNNMALLINLSTMPELTHKTYSRAEINRPKNTVLLRNPRHSFRSYFKHTKFSQEQKKQLTEFLSNQDHIRMAPSLQKWTQEFQYTRLQDYFFVDYTTPSWLTMLSLIHPGLIRKTVCIVPATK